MSSVGVATPLGQLLIDRGLIAAEDLDRALELQRERRGEKLGKILVDMGYIAQRDLLTALSEQLGLPIVIMALNSARRLRRRNSKDCRRAFFASPASFRLPSKKARSRWRWPIRSISKPSMRSRAFRGSKSVRSWRTSRTFSTPSTAITAKATGRPPQPNSARAMKRISSTCATWRAKRRSSGSSTR